MWVGRQGTLERHFASLDLSFPIWLCVHSFIQQTFPEFIHWKQLEDGPGSGLASQPQYPGQSGHLLKIR